MREFSSEVNMLFAAIQHEVAKMQEVTSQQQQQLMQAVEEQKHENTTASNRIRSEEQAKNLQETRNADLQQTLSGLSQQKLKLEGKCAELEDSLEEESKQR